VSSTVPPTKPPASGSPETNGKSAPPLYSTRFKIVAAVLVTLAVGAFVAAYLSTSGDGDDGTGAGGAGAGAFVERLMPGRDTQVVQQGTVGIDLAPGWEGSLVIDGVAIPSEDVDVTESLGLVQFTPGSGKIMRTLPVGNICAQATVFETSTGPRDSRLVSWCFDVI
jgi:hypothetical protein